MIFGYLILLVALILSAVAAFYSVTGLVAIFAALPIPIIIMGSTLEAAKIVSTVWLHNNWNRAGLVFKMYLVPAIVVLMFLTSVGIFGLLSKAHGDQSLVSGDAIAKVAIFDEKIKISKDNIDANRKALKQMDEAVDQIMGRSVDEKGIDKAVSIRRSQQKERQRLRSEIASEQKTITSLSEESAPLRAEFRKVEAEVGPIKYIAALIYGDTASQSMLEAAVRWVIILIVVVFDPLALCLILAANKQLEWGREGKGGWVHNEGEPKEEKQSKLEPVPEVKIEEVPAVVEEVPAVEDIVNFEPDTEFNQKLEIIESLDHLTIIDEQEENATVVAAPNLVWDPSSKSWRPDSEELQWHRNISRRFNRLNPDYVSLDGKLYNQNELPVTQEIMSLETVKNLMHRLTNEEMSVDDLSWTECEAILKYLDNDKSTNIT